MVMFYISAAWQAICRVFQGVIVRGCVFHCTQRIYRQVLRLGLSSSYTSGGDTYTFIRKLLALPFLPVEHIKEAVRELKDLAEGTTDEVDRLLLYIQQTWRDRRVWQPEHWSVFRETVRTNNDVITFKGNY